MPPDDDDRIGRVAARERYIADGPTTPPPAPERRIAAVREKWAESEGRCKSPWA